ncbi:MAG: hypothetical protein ACK4YS_02700 [Aphanizomenon sp.]|jgi:hypothetical protein
MLFINRITGDKTNEIPQKTILGQWQIITDSEKIFLNSFELSINFQQYIIPDTNYHYSLRNAEQELISEQQFPHWQVPSDILADSLRFFYLETQKLLTNGASWQDFVKIPPLVPEIEEKINIQPLEETIKKYLGHIEEVCRRPRSYLKLETDKLPVSRAQRISPHAIEFLASHTEDWQYRSFRSIVPKQILCMVREELFDIYENQVTVSLIDHLLIYINRRIQQIKTIKKQLEEVEYLSESKDIYWRNKQRIYTLWGNQFDAGTAVKKAAETLSKLQQIQQKLRSLLDTDLYKTLSSRAKIGTTLKRTNILINDQHYRYVDLLWREWSRNQSEKVKTTQQVFTENQQLFHGFESFCFLLIAIALTGSGQESDQGFGLTTLNNIIPEIGCDTIKFRGALGEIHLKWQIDGSFLLESPILSNLGLSNLHLIPLLATISATNNHELIDSALQILSTDQQINHQNQICILYPGTEEEINNFSDELQQKVNNINPNLSVKILPVSPLDIFSVERVARMIQWWLNGQKYQSYPPIISTQIPENIVFQLPWLQKDKTPHKTQNQFLVLRKPSEKEQNNLQNYLAQEITDAKAKGHNRKGIVKQLQEIETENLPLMSQQLIEPLEVCPVCYSHGKLTPSDNQSFNCECPECNSSWGKRTCGKCRKKYPFIQLQGIENYLRFHKSIDRTFGRDILVKPITNENNQNTFICPHCK